jgi:hypothetical protein
MRVAWEAYLSDWLEGYLERSMLQQYGKYSSSAYPSNRIKDLIREADNRDGMYFRKGVIMKISCGIARGIGQGSTRETILVDMILPWPLKDGHLVSRYSTREPPLERVLAVEADRYKTP